MVVVGVAATRADLAEFGRDTGPDVLVVGVDGDTLPPEYLALLLERPQMKVLGLRLSDGRAYLYEVRLNEMDIGEVSPDDLVHAIRRALNRD